MSSYQILVVCVLASVISIWLYNLIVRQPPVPCPPHKLEACYDESNDFSAQLERFKVSNLSALESFRVKRKIYRGHVCLRCGARFMFKETEPTEQELQPEKEKQ